MALGVLNNLPAMFAANNLNNTQDSLTKTLQQLSSGSKINSGADDAAGLSLVDGLAANSAALQQSSVNATEGVGLLQVADGSLSQVTSLLNRAITLATEASNGTLNTAQSAAANQEYQSILSEVDNIGTTTTYNQEQVFGSNYDIYTGDSSDAGSSIDGLSIGSLSSSSVGQTDGTMGYYTTDNKTDFLDVGATTATTAGTTALLNAGTLEFQYQTSSGSTATATFTVNANATNGYNITYTSTPAGGSASTPVTVFTSSSATAPTVNDLIGAINSSGLGVTATLTDTTGAGDVATTTPAYTPTATAGDYGIELTGNLSTTAPTSAGQVEATATALVTGQKFDSYASTGSTATISYSGLDGENLSGTDLLNTGDAQSALTAINSAISDVAAQDGYIGAQINTLNAVSNVESTQQENIVSAQNAVQATDYASATSDLSKYEILTQTGISALAQANSVEQEVTKLLQ